MSFTEIIVELIKRCPYIDVSDPDLLEFIYEVWIDCSDEESDDDTVLRAIEHQIIAYTFEKNERDDR